MARRVFVSYSHDDRAWRDAFRQMLGPGLERFDVELWADDHVRSGDDWERAIDHAIGDAVLGVLLVTPAHLTSRFIWTKEVPALLDAGVPVVWVLVEACLWQYKELLGRIQGLQDPGRDGALADHAGQKKELARLCAKICEEHLAGLATVSAPSGEGHRSVPAQAPAARLSPGRPGRVFGPVPERLSAFVPRTEDLDRLRAQLVEGLAASVGIIAKPAAFGLHGQGGVGKTVLAAELTRDTETLAYFPDGVFWLSLGERPDVVGAQRQLAAWLDGDVESIRSPLQGAKVLRELVGQRQCLVVVDDVWSLAWPRPWPSPAPGGGC